jgi:hypothetical protein
MQRFRVTPTWKFISQTCGMRVLLPVEPDTTLAVDRAVSQQMAKISKRSDGKQPALARTIASSKKLRSNAIKMAASASNASHR